MQVVLKALLATALLFTAAMPSFSDEGMWTSHNFPQAAVKSKYSVDITKAWLDRLQRAVVRLESGCTGTLISNRGLVMTNHHCAMDCLADVSTPTSDLLANGFTATSEARELKCPGEVLSLLVGTQEVTSAVAKVVAGLNDADANAARKRELGRLEAACVEANRKTRGGPLACEAVTLYQGGQYFIYKYKRYDDVRLAFAPHAAIASFGGDIDNFNYPRWALDVSVLRAYEHGKPIATPDYLRWRSAGPNAGEPVFVAGYPWATDRLWTTAQLKFLRDTSVPAFLERNTELRGRLIQWSMSSDEAARISQDALFSTDNSLKVYRGYQRALLSDELFEMKAQQEQALLSRLAPDARFRDLRAQFQRIELAQRRYREIFDRYAMVELGQGFSSRLFKHARMLVRGATERDKPNGERLREYADSKLANLEANLLSDSPIYPQFERLTLSFSLDKLRTKLGPDDRFVRAVMGAETPESVAAKLIDHSQLGDVNVRKRLWDGGTAAIAASNDAMIVLARSIDADARALRAIFDDEIQAPTNAAQEKIALARFAALGTETYPDATSTLRFSYGAVESWRENGAEVPNFTRIAQLYERATGKAPFALPQQWLDARADLDADTPVNYVTTNDIVGGNSGSPVVDARGNFVGIAFDGNLHTIASTFWYDPERNRMIAIHPQFILKALQRVYRAEHLTNEILAAQ